MEKKVKKVLKRLSKTERRMLKIMSKEGKGLSMAKLRTIYLEKYGEILPRQKGQEDHVPDYQLFIH